MTVDLVESQGGNTGDVQLCMARTKVVCAWVSVSFSLFVRVVCVDMFVLGRGLCETVRLGLSADRRPTAYCPLFCGTTVVAPPSVSAHMYILSSVREAVITLWSQPAMFSCGCNLLMVENQVFPVPVRRCPSHHALVLGSAVTKCISTRHERCGGGNKLVPNRTC